MTATKRSSMLLTLFFIGLVALVADRTILRPQGGPHSARATDEPADSGLLSDNVPILEPLPPEQSMARQIDGLWSGEMPDFEQMRNPFALPAAWLDVPPKPGERIPDAAALFIRTHQLSAVVLNREGTYALVDDQLLPPGRILDGFTLVEVRDREAVFEREGKQAVLELANK